MAPHLGAPRRFWGYLSVGGSGQPAQRRAPDGPPIRPEQGAMRTVDQMAERDWFLRLAAFSAIGAVLATGCDSVSQASDEIEAAEPPSVALRGLGTSFPLQIRPPVDVYLGPLIISVDKVLLCSPRNFCRLSRTPKKKAEAAAMAEGWAERWTVGDRLDWAIHTHQTQEGRSLGVGLLIKKLEARAETQGEKAVGATYPSIASYLKGETEPPLTFLRAVADVLDVNLAWLALREGAPTKAHAEAVEATDASVAAVQELESMLGSRLNASVQLKLGLPLDWVARNRRLRSWVPPIAEAWGDSRGDTHWPGARGNDRQRTKRSN